MKCVGAKAPGKVILFGEHFVVKGVPAIATAISLYAKVRACRDKRRDGAVAVRSPQYGSSIVWPRCSNASLCFIREIIEEAAKIVGRDPWPATIEIDSEIPPESGLGSSAAVSIATAAAYLLLEEGSSIDPRFVLKAGFRGEKYIHGRPSGIDTTIALYGGTIYYTGLNKFEKIQLDARRIALVIAESGIKRVTGEAVRRVLERRDRLGRIGEELYRLAKLLVEEAKQALTESDYERIGLLMDVNHGLLNALGVSLPILEELVHVARNNGALGAKITGAGLGGSIIALVEAHSVERVVSSISKISKHVYRVYINAPGLSASIT